MPAVIVSAVRTPFGRLGGGLAGKTAVELGSIAIRAGLERAGVDPAEVGYTVMGQVLQAGAGQAPARQAAVAAGIPKEVPADTINKVSELDQLVKGSSVKDRLAALKASKAA